MKRRATMRALVTAAVVLSAIVPAAAGKWPFGQLDTGDIGMEATVEAEPVVVVGSAVPERDGVPLQHFGLYRWDAIEGFVAIPFQIDERLDRTFSPGGEYEFTQNIHDVFNEEPDTLDGDDEIVFLFVDAGPQAPAASDPPSGAEDGLRHEIRVEDVTGEVTEPRFVYLFVGDDLVRSTETRIDWAGQRTGAIETESFAVDFVDRWLLTGYHVNPPCGDGADLIDRVKGRAGISVSQGESEEFWNWSAFYMGGMIGPVRAIRYIRGAASGLNTIHHDIVYPHVWERRIRLRVHSLSSIWIYLDWLPGRAETIYTPRWPDGVPIDGQPDNDPGTSLLDWEVVRGPAGGLVTLYDIPPGPYVQERRRYQRDDEDFDDEPISSPVGYTDDDDAAIGNHGFQLIQVADTEVTPGVIVNARFHPLCADVGDAAIGTAFSNLWKNPPAWSVTPQYVSVAPVRDLEARREIAHIVLAWSASPGATAYRVYASDDPSLDPGSWTLETETAETTWTDDLAALDPGPRYYAVAVVDSGGGEVR